MQINWKMENDKWKIARQRGQALVMLLFFIMVGVIITTAAIFIIAGNSRAASATELGIYAREMADTGVENALLAILRGNFAHEDITLPEGAVSVDITLMNGSPTLVTSTATVGSFVRKVEVNVTYVNNVLSVGSWKEIN